MKHIYALLALLGLSIHASAQIKESDETPAYVTIGAGTGVLSFFGEMNIDNEISTFSNIRSGFHFNAERRLGNYFGVALEGLFGSVAHNQRSASLNLNRNFESAITQLGVSGSFHFDNDRLLKRSSAFSPYLAAGFAYIKFDPYGDLKNKNGTPYHYWSNGLITDLAENDPHAYNANVIFRDYVYESQLTDSGSNYARNSFSIPLTFGLKWKFSEPLEGRFFTTYTITMSDYLDNYSDDAKNDQFLYTGFSVHYSIRKKKETASPFKNVDFVGLAKDDMDKDGIPDWSDKCPDTPVGVKVNSKGCPPDDDKDGVPNYIDKESNTAKGLVVDRYGITIDSAYLARQQAARAAVKIIRTQMIAESPPNMKSSAKTCRRHAHCWHRLP